MFFSGKSEKAAAQDYPNVPNSLKADHYSPSPTPDLTARADTAPSVTPYLSKRARLSQIWINRWTILLLLVLLRLMLLIAQLVDNVGDAKTKALTACSKVEDIGSAMASMPHYLSAGVNDLTGYGIESAVHAMVDVLGLIMQGVEGMIIFFINFMTATYTCLITALIHGSLDVAASVTKDATKEFNDVIDKAADEIGTISKGLTDGINKITAGIKGSIFGGALPDIPKVDFSGPVDDLKKFNLNTDDFVKDVQAINKDIPTFDQVQNLTKQAVSFPFNIARDALNEAFGNYTFKKDVFPLAQKKRLTFCSDNSTLNDFFEKVYKVIKVAKITFIVILSLLAILAIVPMTIWEMHRWHRMKAQAKRIENNREDSMDVVYMASRPWTSRVGIKLSSRFTGTRKVLVRWCVAYATSPPALFVLSLAIAGLFSCFCQWIILKLVIKEVPQLVDKVDAFADEVVTTLQNVSKEWSADANGVIKGVNDDINKDVLIYVTNATDAVNNTLNVFLTEMDKGLNAVFKNTVLLDPIKAVLHCVIGIKIESVQKGLTWVHDHAKVDFPLLPPDVFSLGANESISGDSELNTFLASPSSVTTDEVSGAVDHVINWLRNNIIQEALISTGILLVYVIVVLIGVTRTLVGMANPAAGRGDGGLRYTGDDRPPLSPRAGESSMQQAAATSSTRELTSEKYAQGGRSRPMYTGEKRPYEGKGF